MDAQSNGFVLARMMAIGGAVGMLTGLVTDPDIDKVHPSGLRSRVLLWFGGGMLVSGAVAGLYLSGVRPGGGVWLPRFLTP